MTNTTTKTAPERIWLQVDCDATISVDGAIDGQDEPFSEDGLLERGFNNDRTMGIEELQAAWDAQADKYNQWDDLGLDEIVAFAQQQALIIAADLVDNALGSLTECPCCMERKECQDDCTFAEDCPEDYEQMECLRSVLAMF